MHGVTVEKTFRSNIMICAGTGCVANGSLKVKDALEAELIKRNLQTEVKIVLTGCNGFCAKGPVMVVYPEDIFYQVVKPEDVPHLVEEHFVKGRPVQKFLYTPPTDKKTIPVMNEIPFFKHQVLRALRNRSLIDAEKIEEYIARDGYMAAAKALMEMTPEQIVAEMKKSGLRGRGGAGFLTGLKWELCARVQGDVKYILCNGDEGDPGAFMDRSVMEADPHSVLEGMIIAAKAINAHYGYIYVRAEYPLAVQRLQLAIDSAKEHGLLGKDILGSGYDLDIEIYQGAGAFVCGEETALMASIEGKRGMPRAKPPFPAVKGLWQRPSVLNNVETFANVPPIILHGADWFASLGTEKSKGTKVFALSGALNNIGLVEVPMGTPLKTIIYDIGGGIKGNRKFKAVQMGGPSGGCIPSSLIETPVDFENINKTGAIMGSGGMVVMDETTCMPAMAKFFLEFTEDESCGKCVPCRIGNKTLLTILQRITNGEGREGDIELLLNLSQQIKDTSLCGLGQTSPNPVLTTIKYFREEYEAHIKEKKCPARVCTPLIEFKVNEEKCKKCGQCFRNCPAGAITWEKGKVAYIDQEKCTKCKTCIKNCRFWAID
jgi:NADH:ubiquinone oxidoreductase subunit F (NADH-binding)/(2Fe-2S) ferredoxin/NAD-dependent dihydropyrimidine dehydrogenase PreA subunit